MRGACLLPTLLTFVLLTPPLGAQNKTRGKPRPKITANLVPGYTIQTIKGFTVLLSAETLRHAEDKGYERKPPEVLELELTKMIHMMPVSAIKVLRRVPIWVEWDERKVMPNGRAGMALAVYLGGHQLSMLKQGEHPLKAKSVVIYRMKSLTEEHQPKRDSERCVLLHEMAHAVHFELLGAKNESVRAVYKQAMERRLYDHKLYVSTNELEFFAELTCAYFGQLHHYPHNRAELKKHDAVTYALMVKVWGKGGLGGTTSSERKTAGDPSLRLDQLDLGRHLPGRETPTDSLKGKPVVVLYWNAASPDSLNCLAKLSALNVALSDFGLRMIGVHLTGRAKPDVSSVARARGARFCITEGQWTNRSIIKHFKEFPLCLVFDHKGQCIYRGSPFEAERAARTAVGQALIATGNQGPLLQPVKGLAESLAKGVAPSSVLPRLGFLARSSKGEMAQQARQLLTRITEGGRKKLAEAETLAKEDQVAAYLALVRLSATYKGTPLATRANVLLKQVRQNKAVQVEERARLFLRGVKRLDTDLHSRPGAFAPTSGKFRTENATQLRQLQEAVQHMKKAWPKTRATEEAIRIGKTYGLVIN